MEITQVTQTPTGPLEEVTLVEPVTIADKQSEHEFEVNGVTPDSNNHPEAITEGVKTPPEPESVPQTLTEESRPADLTVTPIAATKIDEGHRIITEGTGEDQVHSRAEVVTPAGTVDVEHEDEPSSPKTTDTPLAELVDDQDPKVSSSNNGPAEVILNEKEDNPAESKPSEAIAPSHPVESLTPPPAEKVEMMQSPRIEHDEVVTASSSTPTSCAPSTTAESAVAAAPSPEKKSRTEKKQNDSFASEETLSELQKFLAFHIAENRCSSHTKEINEFVAKHLNEKQRKRYVAPLVERIVQHFAQEAAAKGEEVSLDVQSNICLIEQMFLTLGRRSPLEDMYTAEEEEMLDLLFHSNSSDDLPIDM